MPTNHNDWNCLSVRDMRDMAARMLAGYGMGSAEACGMCVIEGRALIWAVSTRAELEFVEFVAGTRKRISGKEGSEGCIDSSMRMLIGGYPPPDLGCNG